MGFFEDDKNWQKYESILRTWVGTPYHHLWAAKKRGADCMLFILDAMQKMGIIEKYTYDYYPRDWFLHTKEDLMRPIFEKNIKDNLTGSVQLEPIPIDSDVMRGDIIALAIVIGQPTHHAAVIMGNEKMIHSANSRGVTISTYGKYWRKRITGIYRIIEGK